MISILRRQGDRWVRVVDLDASISEMIEHEATITDHPIESGDTIGDHVITKPARITIEGIVSDKPAIMMDQELVERRSVAAHNAMVDLLESHELVTVVTGLSVYSNVVLHRYNPIRSREVGAALRFEAVFVRVHQAVVEEVTLPEDMTAKAAPDADAGRQPTVEASDGDVRRVSGLKRLGELFVVQ